MDRYMLLLLLGSFLYLLMKDLFVQNGPSLRDAQRKLDRPGATNSATAENLPAIQAERERWRLNAIAQIGRLKSKTKLAESDREELRKMLMCPFPEIEGNAFEILGKDPGELPYLIGHLQAQENTLMQFLDERCQSTSRVNLLERFLQTKNLRLLRTMGGGGREDGRTAFAGVWNIDLTVARRMLEGVLSQEFAHMISDSTTVSLIQPGRRELLPRLGSLIAESSQETQVRISAVMAIAEIDALQGWETLKTALKSETPVVRYTAVEAIGATGRLEAIPLLMSVLKDTNPFVCSMAMEALSRLDAKEAVTFIIDSVDSTQSIVAFSARQALVRMSCRTEISDRLLTNLDKVPAARRAIFFEILAQIEERRVIPFLEAAIEGNNSDLAVAAANGLLLLRETRRLPRIIELSQRLGSEAKDLALTLENDINNVDVAHVLSERLDELQDPDMQYFGIQILLNELKKRPNSSLPRVLIKIGNAENPYVRGAALIGLGSCGGEEGLEATIRGLSDPSEYVRVCAVTTFYERLGKGACDRLAAMLSTEQSEDVLFTILMCFRRNPDHKFLRLLERQIPLLPEEIAVFARQIHEVGSRDTPLPPF
ncbi:MAG: HEAT repeat domain-containing protein [Candidatus Riflebacteria bacterium]|nr:HEAT repeat domain-containing protein [Candidatus Riflebacteria bacterium]